MLKGGLTNAGGGGAELPGAVPKFLTDLQGSQATCLHSKHGESIAVLRILEKMRQTHNTESSSEIPRGCFENPSRTFQDSLWKAKRREGAAMATGWAPGQAPSAPAEPRWHVAGSLGEQEQASDPAGAAEGLHPRLLPLFHLLGFLDNR